MVSYIAVAIALLPAVNAHAFLSWPTIRGADGDEPQSYGSVPSGAVGTGMPTCGKAQFLDVTVADTTTIKAGSKVKFQVKVTAHHKGHLEFRLCDRVMSSGVSGTEAGQDECFQQHVLKRAKPDEVHSDCKVDDPRGDCQPYHEDYPEYWFLPPAKYNEQVAGEDFQDGDAEPVGEYNEHPSLLQEDANSSSAYSAGGLYKMTFWVPSDFSCTSCTLQFWYRTANSCTPDHEAYRCYFQAMETAGWDVNEFLGTGYYPQWKADAWGGNKCPDVKERDVLKRKNNCGEQFKNCADVAVVASGPTPPPTPQPPTPPPTPQPPTSAPATPAPTATSATAEPEPEPEPATAAPATPATGECTDSAFTADGWTHWTGQCSAFGIGDCAHDAVKEACCMCGGGSSLSQTKVGKVQAHRFRGAKGSSLMEEWAERDIHDEPLLEAPGPQDEL